MPQERATLTQARDDLRLMLQRWHGLDGLHATHDAPVIGKAILALDTVISHEVNPARRSERLALELLFGELIDEDVPLGKLRRIVLSARESMANIQDDAQESAGVAPALMVLVARELVSLLMSADD